MTWMSCIRSGSKSVRGDRRSENSPVPVSVEHMEQLTTTYGIFLYKTFILPMQ